MTSVQLRACVSISTVPVTVLGKCKHTEETGEYKMLAFDRGGGWGPRKLINTCGPPDNQRTC